MNVQKFWENNSDGLLKVYIIERKKHNNELGVLLSIIDSETSENTMYLTLSNKMLSDELKKDVMEKNNDRNSLAFFVL